MRGRPEIRIKFNQVTMVPTTPRMELGSALRDRRVARLTTVLMVIASRTPHECGDGTKFDRTIGCYVLTSNAWLLPNSLSRNGACVSDIRP